MWEGQWSLFEIKKWSSGGRKGVLGRDLSCDWLPPPTHGEVLEPLAAADLKRSQTADEEVELSRCHSFVWTLHLREKPLFALTRTQNTSIHIYLLKLTRGWCRTEPPERENCGSFISGKVSAAQSSPPAGFFGVELGYREEFWPGSLSVEVSYDELLKNVALLLFCAECVFLRAGGAKSAQRVRSICSL